MRKYISKSEQESSRIAEILARLCRPGDVILLEGPPGAGKTRFSQAFAAALEVRQRVTSPTFPIIREYRGRLPLYHMDLYRLKDSEEFILTGGEELLFGDGICIIEWPDRAEELYPRESIRVYINITGDEEREIIIVAPKSMEKGLPDEC